MTSAAAKPMSRRVLNESGTITRLWTHGDCPRRPALARLRWPFTLLVFHTSVAVTSANVDAQVPLSLLEAVRSLDRPAEGQETEYVPELRNKRLGLSDTVYAQIRRYTDAVKRNQRIARDEAAALARLLSRRPDADLIFREAGRHLARASFATLSPLTRNILVSFPGLMTRPMALRRLRRLAERYLSASVRRVGSYVFLGVGDAVAAEGEDTDAGRVFYEAALREYVALLVGASGAVEQTRSGARGSGYEWRAEWRAASPAERRAFRAAAFERLT
jgi:hypothetical protein